jgi:DNA polymerase-1
MIALIDGDVLVYKAAWAAETPMECEGGTYLGVDHGTVQSIVEHCFDQILSAVKPDRMIVCLTAPDGVFRTDVYPAYKSNRKKERKPLAWKAAREWIESTCETFVRPKLEADDVMGILATGRVKGLKGDRVICSIDKDMRQVPGLHFNWNEKSEHAGMSVVSEAEGDRLFYLQTIAGDPIDGFPGVPKIGMVKAEKMLEAARKDSETIITHDEWYWSIVLDAYRKAGLSEEFALTMARCARILRACDYDFKKKEVKLWCPPK